MSRQKILNISLTMICSVVVEATLAKLSNGFGLSHTLIRLSSLRQIMDSKTLTGWYSSKMILKP